MFPTKFREAFRLAFVVIALSVAGCTSPDLPNLPVSASSGSGYRLGPGDHVTIKVLGAENLSGDYVVGDDGTINMPMVGKIRAAGQTDSQVERVVAQQLGAGGYMTNPSATVSVAKYRPFYIYGEVNKPGQYLYSDGMRVLSAVSVAGGFTARAQDKSAVIERDGHAYAANGMSAVQPDDIIKIPERFF